MKRKCSICKKRVSDKIAYRLYKAHGECVFMKERKLTFVDGSTPWNPATTTRKKEPMLSIQQVQSALSDYLEESSLRTYSDTDLTIVNALSSLLDSLVYTEESNDKQDFAVAKHNDDTEDEEDFDLKYAPYKVGDIIEWPVSGNQGRGTVQGVTRTEIDVYALRMNNANYGSASDAVIRSNFTLYLRGNGRTIRGNHKTHKMARMPSLFPFTVGDKVRLLIGQEYEKTGTVRVITSGTSLNHPMVRVGLDDGTDYSIEYTNGSYLPKHCGVEVL